jgi:pyruvate formate lyase activating enzyme
VRTGASGWVFDVRRYSLHDGPGIRTTVFLKGCPLRCAWCHNPESQSPQPHLLYRTERCLGCGACLEACPAGALERRGDVIVTDPERCTTCGRCAQACPADAREVVGRHVRAVEVLEGVERDRPFFDESGGGVTFSGGEPLFQPAFLRSLIAGCQARGLHVTLDTSGHAATATVLEFGRAADLVLYDLKHMDSAAHEGGTGVSNHLILANLRQLVDAGADVIVRVPLVPGFNDDAENLGRTARFVGSLGAVRLVQLLPFHTAAKGKHHRFALPYRAAATRTHTDAELSEIRSWFERADIHVEIGG